MTQQVQELINKIKTEAIDAAQKKAEEIEAQAKTKAHEIIAKAQEETNKLKADAEAQIAKSKEAAEKALKQAARDTLLDLRSEIEKILKKIVFQSVGEALTPEELARLLGILVEKSLEKSSGNSGIQAVLSPSDLEKVKKGFLAKLQGRLKEGIRLEPSADISKGFLISFDGGKSAFDFTDVSLAEYIASYLNPEVAALIKDKKSV